MQLHESQDVRRRRAWRLGAGAISIGCVAVALLVPSYGSASANVRAHSTNTAAAKAAIAPYVGHPSPFDAPAPLTKLPKAGSNFTYIQCAIPECALVGKDLVAPAKALGVKLHIVNSATTPAALQASIGTVLTEKPAALLLTAVAPQFFGGLLHKVDAAGTKVIGVGMVNAKQYGVQQVVGNNTGDTLAGALMADWVVARLGAKANVVFYGTPELSFSPYMQKGFTSTMAKLCPSCTVATQQASVTTFGTTAPQTVVSYLQSKPSTNTVVFASEEGMEGLPAALKDAGLNITTMGYAPDAGNLQDIKDGGLTGGLALDFNVQSWRWFDVAARLMNHQTVSAAELDTAPLEFLTKGTPVHVDPSGQWTGYPDVAKLFAPIWHPKAKS